MTEDFVSYQQAVKLKAAGFDWECETYYRDGYDGIWYSRKMNQNAFGASCSTPLLSQAQKWLREKMGIDLIVSPKFDSKTGYRIGYFWRWAQRTDIIDTKTYSTYEFALSVGIDAALGLIENKGE